ncbi:MAG: hypothetical protein NXI24_20100 [bacterium]|nr:hypothetical protein [bacterium]
MNPISVRLCIVLIPLLIGVVLSYDSDRGLLAEPVAEAPREIEAGLFSLIIRIPEGVDRAEVTNVLRRIVGNDVSVAPNLQKNAIAVIGSGTTVNHIEEIMKGLMLPMSGRSGTRVFSPDFVQIYRAKHITADSLASVLLGLPDPQYLSPPVSKSAAAAVLSNQQFGGIRAIAYAPGNSVIVIASPEEWSEIVKLIQDLDQLRQQIRIQRDWLLQFMEKPDELYENKFSPAIANSKIVGWKLIYVPGDNFLYQHGVRSGDILRQFNGEPLDTQEKLILMIQTIKSSDRFTLGVERGGKTFIYEILVQ